MKIKSIQVKKHKILGDLALDFTKSDGEIADTVILAGENGCGKSTILKIIYDFCSLSLKDITSDEDEKEIKIVLTDDEISILEKNTENHKKQLFFRGVKNNEMIFFYDYSIKNNWNQIKVKFRDLDGKENISNATLFNKKETKLILKSIFSDVEINFTPAKISNVTSKDIDSEISNIVKSTGNIATEISQLLIDIQALDDAEFTAWARNNIGKKISESDFNLRISRFTNAFNYMFDSIKYKGIENINNSKKIIFETLKGNIYIDDLSSGEKQIVFRGSFLLKDKENNKGSLILIDEPEISLHPSWQKKIAMFNKLLFTNQDGNQTSQIFIATHSPFIIHNSNRYNDKVIVLRKDKENSFISSESSPEYISWSNEKKVQDAFNITLSSTKVTIFVEGITDETYLNKAIDILNYGNLPVEFKWVGAINSNGNAVFTGDKSLNHVKSFYQANIELLEKKIILLYDSDTNKPFENINNLVYIRKMPENFSNVLYKKGIENLLELPESFDKHRFYNERIKTDPYGAESIIRDLDKVKLCTYICNDLNKEEQNLCFKNFKTIFDCIDEILEEKS